MISQSRRKGKTNSDDAPSARTTANITLRASNETNLRSYCPTSPRHGCLTSHYESDYAVTPADEVRIQVFSWLFAQPSFSSTDLGSNLELSTQTGEPSPVVVSEKADFWRMAHEMTVRHNRAKCANEPIKALR